MALCLPFIQPEVGCVGSDDAGLGGGTVGRRVVLLHIFFAVEVVLRVCVCECVCPGWVLTLPSRRRSLGVKYLSLLLFEFVLLSVCRLLARWLRCGRVRLCLNSIQQVRRTKLLPALRTLYISHTPRFVSSSVTLPSLYTSVGSVSLGRAGIGSGTTTGVAKAETFKMCLADAFGPLLHACVHLGDVAAEVAVEADGALAGAVGGDDGPSDDGSSASSGDPTFSALLKFYAVRGLAVAVAVSCGRARVSVCVHCANGSPSLIGFGG